MPAAFHQAARDDPRIVDLQQLPNDKDMNVVDWGKKYCPVMLLGRSGELLYEKQA